MFLKTESDRPVRPSAGHDSGPIRSIGPENGQSEIKPVKPVVQPENRMNGLFRTVRFNFFIYIFPPLSSFPSGVLPAGPPPPLQSQPATPLLEPLALEKLKSFPFFPVGNPHPCAGSGNPTPKTPLPAPLLSSRFFLKLFFTSLLFISFYIYYFFIL